MSTAMMFQATPQYQQKEAAQPKSPSSRKRCSFATIQESTIAHPCSKLLREGQKGAIHLASPSASVCNIAQVALPAPNASSKVTVDLGRVRVTEGSIAIGFQDKDGYWIKYKSFEAMTDGISDYENVTLELCPAVPAKLVIRNWDKKVASRATFSHFRMHFD